MISRPSDLSRGERPDRSTARRHWTVADLLTWTESHFAKLGLATPRLDAELLLAHAMGCSRLELYTGYRQVVESTERADFRALVTRRGNFEPVAYILGVREFYSLSFEVDRSVLIPRPETEHLVDRVLQETREIVDRPLAILDLGTGSGNIAVALARNIDLSRVAAVDLSPDALLIARKNARKHGVDDRIDFFEGDLFAALPHDGSAGAAFDVIVSNPPYIALSEYADLMRDVRDHEPTVALQDSKAGTGLGFYREIIGDAARYATPGGLLAFEVGATQARAVEAMLEENGWSDVHTVSDYAGIPRVVTARRA